MCHLATVTVICLATLVACGDDGDSGSTTETSIDTAGDVTSETETTAGDTENDTVPTPEGRASFQFVDDSPELNPVGGVIVWWTPPGGTRIETTADDEGRITFEGLDWSKGSAEILGVKGDYAPTGALVDEAFLASDRFPGSESGHKYLKLTPLAPPPRVTWTGTATGMTDPTSRITVSTDTWGPSATGTLPFRIQVPPSSTFNWSAYAWRLISSDTRGYEAQILDFASGEMQSGAESFEASIDFAADAATPVRASGTFPVMNSARSTLGAVGAGGVIVWARRNLAGQIGTAERVAISGNGANVEYDAAWIEPSWADLMTTAYSLTGGGEHSVTLLRGPPRQGAHEVPLMVPPTWQESTGPIHPIDQPLRWVTDEPEVPVVLTVVIPSGGTARLGGRWALPPGTTEFTLPAELPGGVALFDYLGPNALAAQVDLCEIDRTLSDRFCARYATSKTLGLARPR